MKTNIIPFQSQPKIQCSRPGRSGAKFRNAILLTTGIIVVGATLLVASCGRGEKQKQPRYPSLQAYWEARAIKCDSLLNVAKLSRAQVESLVKIVESVEKDTLFATRFLTEADVLVTLDYYRQFLGEGVKEATIMYQFNLKIKNLLKERDQRVDILKNSGRSRKSISRGTSLILEEYAEKINALLRQEAVLLAFHGQLTQLQRAALYNALVSGSP